MPIFETKVASFETKVASFETKVARFETEIARFKSKGASFETKVASFETKSARFWGSPHLKTVAGWMDRWMESERIINALLLLFSRSSHHPCNIFPA